MKLEVEIRPKKTKNSKDFFVCFEAMTKGFIRGLQALVWNRWVPLKGPFGRVLLVVVVVDGNKGMFPIAFAIVEIKCISSWKFFFNHLKDTLESVLEWSVGPPLTIMFDMQKVRTLISLILF